MERRVLLIIMDGWGLAPAGPGNAISLAETPNFDYYWTKYSHKKLLASGEAVGLPKGQMGNSEVGHLNIGAGRIVLQDLPRISQAIKDKSFFSNETLKKTFKYARDNNKPVHLLGLVSDGGVHSHEKHLYALLEMAKKEKIKKVYIHAFTDGRDVGPRSATTYIKRLEKVINTYKIGQIATVSGRYFAMDRDNRWDRIEKAYQAIVLGQGVEATSPEKAIEFAYGKGQNDEFIEPTVINRKGRIKDGDAVIFFNLRSDRPRELSKALILPTFSGFEREKVVKNLFFVTMTEYEKDLPVSGVLFPPEREKMCLAETLSKADKKQLHIAETEKYAHVTFFLNGGIEEPFFGEKRIMIPSPKVKTYDLDPEMSSAGITEALIAELDNFDFIVVNYANLDMVGHTGIIPATVKACEAVDRCLGVLVKKALEKDYTVLITADHGNAEVMLDAEGKPMTAHTTNPVPLILIGDEVLKNSDESKLGNISPTILDIMDIRKPKEMSESSLLRRSNV
jgi:2,3-bisphosphoglycerate-independent phosphoglycerate mutase